MTGRETVTLALLVAAVFAAALSFRTVTAARERYAPSFPEAFERGRRALPALGAARVRSAVPDAAARLAALQGRRIRRVLQPARAQAPLRTGRLLYAPAGEAERILAEAKEGRLPAVLPPAPDTSPWFRDARGPYGCDVILAEGEGLELVRETLPGAEIDGEPVLREAEERDRGAIPRALLLGLVVACAPLAWRRDFREAERRLLAAIAPIALLGLLGWGVDAGAAAAACAVAAAPFALPLAGGGAALLLSSPSVARVGLVLLAGALLRGGFPREPSGRADRSAWIRLAAATGLLLLSMVAPLPDSAWGSEPAAVLVAPEAAAATASALRAAGAGTVLGDAPLLPPPADARTRRTLREIFDVAGARLRTAPEAERAGWTDLAEAAGAESLYLPSDLREKLQTADGRAVLWLPAPRGIVEGALGPSQYRWAGERRMRLEGRAAGVLAFLVAGLLLLWRKRAGSASLVLAACAGCLAAGSLLYWFAPPGAGTEAVYPLIAVCAFAPGWGLAAALAAGAICTPWAAGGASVAAAVTWAVRRLR